MSDHAAIGERYPGFELTVERGKVREFARAVQSTDPEHLEGEHPVIPPTWLMASGFWMPEDLAHPVLDLGFDPARLLHAGQEFRFFGTPPRAGDILTTESWIDRVYEKEGKRGGTMRFAEISTAYRDADGALVAESRMTLLETSKPAGADS